MCYLLGVDPTYIPFTLVFTFVMTMILLEEKQRDLLIEKIFPQFAINFFRWIWAFVSSPTKKKIESEFDNVNEDAITAKYDNSLHAEMYDNTEAAIVDDASI